jgi:glycerol-3-phosphate O-acyltransferase
MYKGSNSLSNSLKRLGFKLMSWPVKRLVKPTVLPNNPVEDLQLDLNAPIHYVLSHYSSVDLSVLAQYCQQAGLPSPFTNHNGKACYIFIRKNKRFWNSSTNYKRHEPRLNELLKQQGIQPEQNVQLVPVSIAWGRNPGKEKSFIRLVFSNALGGIGALRKMLVVLVQGRHSFLTIGKPLNLAPILESGGSQAHMTRKLVRVLRVYFHRQKTASLGPVVYDRRLLNKSVIATPQVKAAITREATKKKLSKQEVRAEALKYAKEITSNYSYTVVRLMETVLGWVWNKIYDGVEVTNIDRLRDLARDYELVYMPCHRSHMDYLLVSYVLYHQGLVPPHIAAGINLNFWPVGSILRRGGAFFIRRTFKGNKLYSAVFNSYLNTLFQRGYSVEFFPEGGRSRTGRLLAPKTGMLSMTLENLMQGAKKPLLLVPVYLGYDKIMEGNSYLGELKGQAKQSESIGQLLGVRKTLKQSFGQVYVNFGDPVDVGKWLDSSYPDWQQTQGKYTERPKWFNNAVKHLAEQMMIGINKATAVSPITLVSMVMLSTPRYAIDKQELLAQLDLYLELLKRVPYSDDVIIPEGGSEQLLAQAEKLNAVSTATQAMGQITFCSEQTAVLMTYYRNNIIHLFVLPALIASCFRTANSLGRKRLKDQCLLIYPYLKNELTLQWDEQAFDEALTCCIEFMITESLLEEKANKLWRPVENSDKLRQLMLLSETIQSILKRYSLVLTLLKNKKDKGLTRTQLETDSQRLAERIAILYDINAPESFDRKIFSSMINILKNQGAIELNDQGELISSPQVEQLYQAILTMLPFTTQQRLQHSLS